MTHIELLIRSRCTFASPTCEHQLAKLGTWVEPGCAARKLIMSVFHCRHCDVAIEIRHLPSRGLPAMQFEKQYPYSTSFRGRRVRS